MQIKKALTKEILRESIWQTVRIWAWPILAMGVSVVIGWIQDFPLYYLYIGALFSGACFSTGILRFDEWRERNRVEYKLTFNAVRVAKKLKDDGSVQSISLGFKLSNMAAFPIAFRVDELDTQFKDRYPPKKDYEINEITVAPGGVGWFSDHSIDVPVPPVNQAAEGLLRFRLTYGRPNHLRYVLEEKRRCLLASMIRGMHR